MTVDFLINQLEHELFNDGEGSDPDQLLWRRAWNASHRSVIGQLRLMRTRAGLVELRDAAPPTRLDFDLSETGGES